MRGHPDADQLELNIRAFKHVVENGIEDDNIIKEKVKVEYKDEVTTNENPDLSHETLPGEHLARLVIPQACFR